MYNKLQYKFKYIQFNLHLKGQLD